MTGRVLDGVRDLRLTRPDGRTVAWSEWGDRTGLPLLRLPGTPGCRFSSLRPDRRPWQQRGLWVITTERPGFGASTPLPGRRFDEHADDLVAILDHLGLESVHVIGGSGGAPYELALAARYPARVRAMTVLVGAAPTTDEEFEREIGLNREAHRLIRAGDTEGFRRLLTESRESLLADPTAAFSTVMERAPEKDRAVMSDPRWQESFVVAVTEALRPGIEGWFDEALAIDSAWSDIEVEAVTTSLTWWHAASDANAPLTAAQRLLRRVPHARLRLFDGDEGHLAGYHREGEVLDDLIARG